MAAGRLRGPAGRRLTGQLQAAQVRYAMIRSGSDSLTDPALEAIRLKIRSIRSELAASPVLSMPSQTRMPTADLVSMSGIPSGPVPGEPAPAQAPAGPTYAGSTPAAPVPAAQAPAWVPTHVVPAGGLPAWRAPTPHAGSVAVLSERVELVVVSRAGAWRPSGIDHGWTGGWTASPVARH